MFEKELYKMVTGKIHDEMPDDPMSEIDSIFYFSTLPELIHKFNHTTLSYISNDMTMQAHAQFFKVLIDLAQKIEYLSIDDVLRIEWSKYIKTAELSDEVDLSPDDHDESKLFFDDDESQDSVITLVEGMESYITVIVK